jgi:hypothetical protein
MSKRVPWAIVSMLFLVGCSRGPTAFTVPKVDVEAAATKAIELYDKNGDQLLGKDELAKCPALLAKLKLYDADNNGSIDHKEIAQHLGALLNRTGGSQLNALVLFKGQPLKDAKVVMEPEPFLGGTVSAAEGTTDGAGNAKMGIPAELAPEHLRKFKVVHYGVFKVRITHPTAKIPAKYNTDTELGYETEVGNPNATFTLSAK